MSPIGGASDSSPQSVTSVLLISGFALPQEEPTSPAPA
jgi:hypothetical protein